GVVILASPSGGAVPATISVEGGASTLTLTAGDQVVVTHGSVVLDVVSGPVEASFVALGGDATVATAVLAEGSSLTFEPDTLTFIAETQVTVVLIGSDEAQATATISAGDEISFDPESFEVTADADNNSPVTIVLSTGEAISASPGTTVHAAVQTVVVN